MTEYTHVESVQAATGVEVPVAGEDDPDVRSNSQCSIYDRAGNLLRENINSTYASAKKYKTSGKTAMLQFDELQMAFPKDMDKFTEDSPTDYWSDSAAATTDDVSSIENSTHDEGYRGKCVKFYDSGSTYNVQFPPNGTAMVDMTEYFLTTRPLWRAMLWTDVGGNAHTVNITFYDQSANSVQYQIAVDENDTLYEIDTWNDTPSAGSAAAVDWDDLDRVKIDTVTSDVPLFIDAMHFVSQILDGYYVKIEGGRPGEFEEEFWGEVVTTEILQDRSYSLRLHDFLRKADTSNKITKLFYSAVVDREELALTRFEINACTTATEFDWNDASGNDITVAQTAGNGYAGGDGTVGANDTTAKREGGGSIKVTTGAGYVGRIEDIRHDIGSGSEIDISKWLYLYVWHMCDAASQAIQFYIEDSSNNVSYWSITTNDVASFFLRSQITLDSPDGKDGANYADLTDIRYVGWRNLSNNNTVYNFDAIQGPQYSLLSQYPSSFPLVDLEYFRPVGAWSDYVQDSNKIYTLNSWIGQQFIADRIEPLRSIWMRVKGWAPGAAGDFVVEIRTNDDNAGSPQPSNIILPHASIATVSAALTADWGWKEFTFERPIDLAPGQLYWIVLKNISGDVNNYYYVKMCLDQAGNNLKVLDTLTKESVNDGAAWANTLTEDVAFVLNYDQWEPLKPELDYILTNDATGPRYATLIGKSNFSIVDNYNLAGEQGLGGADVPLIRATYFYGTINLSDVLDGLNDYVEGFINSVDTTGITDVTDIPLLVFDSLSVFEIWQQLCQLYNLEMYAVRNGTDKADVYFVDLAATTDEPVAFIVDADEWWGPDALNGDGEVIPIQPTSRYQTDQLQSYNDIVGIGNGVALHVKDRASLANYPNRQGHDIIRSDITDINQLWDVVLAELLINEMPKKLRTIITTGSHAFDTNDLVWVYHSKSLTRKQAYVVEEIDQEYHAQSRWQSRATLQSYDENLGQSQQRETARRIVLDRISSDMFVPVKKNYIVNCYDDSATVGAITDAWMRVGTGGNPVATADTSLQTPVGTAVKCEVAEDTIKDRGTYRTFVATFLGTDIGTAKVDEVQLFSDADLRTSIGYATLNPLEYDVFKGGSITVCFDADES